MRILRAGAGAKERRSRPTAAHKRQRQRRRSAAGRTTTRTATTSTHPKWLGGGAKEASQNTTNRKAFAMRRCGSDVDIDVSVDASVVHVFWNDRARS
ncbi:hypothetical protein ACLKA7_006715 [Drosophila subpalustris]